MNTKEASCNPHAQPPPLDPPLYSSASGRIGWNSAQTKASTYFYKLKDNVGFFNQYILVICNKVFQYLEQWSYMPKSY